MENHFTDLVDSDNYDCMQIIYQRLICCHLFIKISFSVLTLCFATLLSYFAYQFWFTEVNEDEEDSSEKDESAVGSPPAPGKKKSASELIKDMEAEEAEAAAEAAEKDSVTVALPTTLPPVPTPKNPSSEASAQPKQVPFIALCNLQKVAANH